MLTQRLPADWKQRVPSGARKCCTIRRCSFSMSPSPGGSHGAAGQFLEPGYNDSPAAHCHLVTTPLPGRKRSRCNRLCFMVAAKM